MKVRESGMPDENKWAEFFKPEKILSVMELSHNMADVVEFGCGYGTFTIPAAKIIKGAVYAIDIEEEMIKRVAERANEEKLNNIKTLLRDFVNEGSGLEDRSADYAMLFNILHAEKPETLLKEAYRIIKPGGKLGVIHWNYDPETPRGPPMTIRPVPEHCIKWAIEVGFKFEKRHDLKPYHYGLVFSKPGRE
ncbi:MAG TPA: class I SAM-dependent methyltransferase [Methanosarcina sp.]|nr:class I SAM-dependent methyltransferase [Methanosarcina sp.]